MADYYDAQILQALNEILTELRKITEPEKTVADYTLTGRVATVQKVTEQADEILTITERAYGKYPSR